MIVEGQHLSYRNVVSKFYTTYPEDMGLVIEDFSKELEKRKLNPASPFFYSIITDVRERPLTMEVFVSVEEVQLPNINDDELLFRSYFLVDNLLMTRVTENYEEEAIEKHFELINYTIENDMEIGSHFFVMPRIVQDKTYFEIYLKALYR